MSWVSKYLCFSHRRTRWLRLGTPRDGSGWSPYSSKYNAMLTVRWTCPEFNLLSVIFLYSPSLVIVIIWGIVLPTIKLNTKVWSTALTTWFETPSVVTNSSQRAIRSLSSNRWKGITGSRATTSRHITMRPRSLLAKLRSLRMSYAMYHVSRTPWLIRLRTKLSNVGIRIHYNIHIPLD